MTGQGRRCDFAKLLELGCPCADNEPASVLAVIEFEDGRRETFHLCESCARYQQEVSKGDSRTPRMVTLSTDSG